MEKSLKWKIFMWGLMLLILFWIIMLPVWCKAEPRPWTDGEKALLFWSTVATLADGYTTCRMLDDPDNWERNPILGKHPDNEQVVIYLSISQIVTVIIAHFWPDMRKYLLGGKACIDTGCAINNYNLIKTGEGF